MQTKHVTYVAKNHMYWECEEGIPYSEYSPLRCIGLGSQNQCFKIKLNISLTIVPRKKEICKNKDLQSNLETSYCFEYEYHQSLLYEDPSGIE